MLLLWAICIQSWHLRSYQNCFSPAQPKAAYNTTKKKESSHSEMLLMQKSRITFLWLSSKSITFKWRLERKSATSMLLPRCRITRRLWLHTAVLYHWVKLRRARGILDVLTGDRKEDSWVQEIRNFREFEGKDWHNKKSGKTKQLLK